MIDKIFPPLMAFMAIANFILAYAFWGDMVAVINIGVGVICLICALSTWPWCGPRSEHNEEEVIIPDTEITPESKN